MWNGNTKYTSTDSTNYAIILSFLDTNEKESIVKAYGFFSHSINYMPRVFKLLPRSQIPGNSYSDPYYLESGLYKIHLQKASSCSSPVSLTVVNNIKENLPLVVRSGASIDGTTKAAFGFDGTINVDWIQRTEFEQYYEIETTLTLRIWEYDYSTQSKIGTPIHYQQKVERIYYDDTINVQFNDWTPPATGHYYVEVKSSVTDPKCSSQTTMESHQIVQVWEDYPRDECYSLTTSLTTDPMDPQINEPITITFNKLSNYANDYDAWDSRYALTPTKSKVILNIQGDADETKNFNLAANPTDTFKQYSVSWTPPMEGTYDLELLVESRDYTCPEGATLAT